ncbi:MULTISPECIES: HD domain-containing protein [Streptomyces]|uniref:HD domain-containing protein n=1 Tax=Streptomyces TaxID=1883 RepID=UPI000F658E18|nr:caspase family protein [Streptomyces alboflavus]
MAPARTALLIGVGHVPAADGLLEPLDDAVDADLRLMNSALQAARYDVTVLHNAGISQIRARIHETARAVPEGGTLLLYFSGHGVRVGDIDYLVPFDAVTPPDGDWQEPYLDSLLPTAISPWLKSSRAGTVLWAIDACRTELPGDDVPFGNSVDNGPPGGGFAVLMGCKAGERSGFTGEGSFFTRGLAEALGPLTPDRSVEDVFANAAARAKAVAHRHGLTQNAHIRYGTNFEDRTKATEICEGRPLLEAWQEAVRTTPLWECAEPRDDDGVQRFKDCLSAFVERSAHTLHLAQSRLPFEDPWADDTYPVRLLCDRLPALLPDGAKLSAVEVAALVAAPFLREAAWAERLSQAAEFGPESLERVPGADAHRRHYEQVGDQYARVARKVAECHARDRPQDAVAVTMWLVHRWVADRFETDDEAVPATCADALATALLGGSAPAPDRVAELSGLMRAAAAGIGLDEPLDDSGTPRDVERGPAKVLLPGGYQPLRMRPLAALLRLAGVLSLDVRTFPEVVAEHLAVSDPVLPQEIVGLVSHPDLLSWQPEGTTLHLDVPCPHQAVHAALVDVAHQADQLATQVADLAGTLPEAEACLLSAVPTRVTDRDLRASQRGGQATYEVPLLRFHLAQTEVRELLMGEQLYGGEPHLALRELYQNAMDACRYRQMRWDYLDSAGPQPAPWRGRISITMGEDARGRYVECRDNGVGMSAEQLKYTFTRAGSRFEQSKAFRREQSRWLRHDQKLRLFPNSRFGIGVFSYFMLADEMTIVTRQVSPDGIPAAQALSVEIPSSGSLFRIQRHEGAGDGLPEGGTRVRLYLRADGTADGLSCVGTLRPLVRVSEFELEVRDLAGAVHEWQPGVLQSRVGLDLIEPLEAVPGVLWWVGEKGGVLCDGITTDVAPYGYVLNLTGLHAGQLSVSRKELQAYDRTWEEHNWRAGAVPLAQWPGLSMEWLWELERQNLPVARVLWREWRGKGVTPAREVDGRHWLDTEGWFHPDQAIATRRHHGSDAGQLAPWRAAALHLTHSSHAASAPRSLVGHPVPEPGDAMLHGSNRNWWHAVDQAAALNMPVAEALLRKRRLRIAHPAVASPAVREGDLDRVPDARDRILAQILAGAGRFIAVEGDHKVSQGRGSLVLASEDAAEPLGDVVARHARWAPLHGESLPPVPAHHQHYVCTQEDVEVLFLRSTNVYGYEDKLRPVTDPRQVLQVQEMTGRGRADILRVLADFAWLGWTAPAADVVRAWAELEPELRLVLSEFTPPAQDGGRTLRWGAAVAMAAHWETDLADASERLARTAAATGLSYERRYAEGDGRVVPCPDTGAIVRELNRVGTHLEDGIGYEALGRAAKGLQYRADIVQVAADLRAAGASLPDQVDLVAEWPTLPLRTRFALSGKEAVYNTEDDPADELTASGLYYTADRLHETLADMWELARQGADRFGLTMPPLPDGLASHRPGSREISALVEQSPVGYVHDIDVDTQYSAAVWKRLTPSALAEYADKLEISPATAYAELAALRPLGALVPELTAAAAAALPTAPLSARDMVALDGNHWLSPTGKAFAPLDLVSIAGRLGEPVPRTLTRVAPFLPLLPDCPPLPAPPDTVPLWQDLAILSVGLDGRLPALTGKVGARHVARAADATGESEAWVTERLRLYAPLFDLDLDLDDAS